jgi:hypothetical protein
MSPSQDSEFPEPDSMTVDPAHPGSVDPYSVEGIFFVALRKSGTEREAFLSLHVRMLRKGSELRRYCRPMSRPVTSFRSRPWQWK